MIGQAYSGFLFLNGDKDRPPTVGKPWVNDYQSALTAVFAALVGYINVQKTGKGQAIDVAQFESGARLMADTFVSYTEANITRVRSGASKAEAFQPYGLFQDKEGDYIAIGAFGPGVYNRFVKAIAIGAQALGIAQACLDESVRYAKERKQFGRPIAANQAIQWMIADMAKDVMAARLLVYNAASLRDEGKPYSMEAAIAKRQRLAGRIRSIGE